MSGSQEANFNFLKTLFPFYLLSDETLLDMAATARRKAFNAGDSIFAPDQAANMLCLVVSGTIRLRGSAERRPGTWHF